jgi:hypothetical protein
LDGKSLNFSSWSFTDPTHQIKIVTPNIDTTIVANYAKYGIYPNPVSDYLIIEYNSLEPVEVGISISTNSGALMMEWKETFSELNFAKKIDLQHLAKGIYILVLETPDGNRVFSIIKN